MYDLATTTDPETNIAEPARISSSKISCWNVFSVDRLTVFKPASVIADVVRNKLSTAEMLS